MLDVVVSLALFDEKPRPGETCRLHTEATPEIDVQWQRVCIQVYAHAPFDASIQTPVRRESDSFSRMTIF
jgi:hypothetical protein